MKKITLIFILSFIFLAAYSQTTLTVGEVYDYDVGDEFHTETSFTYIVNYPPTYRRITVLGKYFSAALDTVFYLIHRNAYTASMSPVFSDTTYMIFYTNLSSVVSHSAYSNCFGVTVDTNYNYCAQLVWERFQRDTVFCFEPHAVKSWYIKGCGGMYTDDSYPAMLYHARFDLVYYKKGNDSCGFPITTGIINPIKDNNLVNIFPNPATNELTIENAALKIKEIEIYSSLGEKVFSQPETNNADASIGTFGQQHVTIGVADFPPGIYFITVTDQAGNKVTKKVVKM